MSDCGFHFHVFAFFFQLSSDDIEYMVFDCLTDSHELLNEDGHDRERKRLGCRGSERLVFVFRLGQPGVSTYAKRYQVVHCTGGAGEVWRYAFSARIGVRRQYERTAGFVMAHGMCLMFYVNGTGRDGTG